MRVANASLKEDIVRPEDAANTQLRLSPAALETPPPTLDEARQSYLDALPIAAAIIGREDGRIVVLTRNARFAALQATRPNGNRNALTQAIGIAAELERFLGAEAAPGPKSFDWRDGDDVGGRHFQANIATLTRPSGGGARCLLTLVDRTAEIEGARSLRAELLHDSLTGLPNRLSFTEAVDQVVADGDGPDHAVLLVDLARFSRINESLGGIAGDELIITVARRLISTLRAGDYLARVGGDEFGVLLRLRNGPDDAPAAARRVQLVLSTPFRLASYEVGLECAIGCALVEAEQASGEELVRNAQLALKRAKETGRVEMHRSGEAAISRYRLDLETELRHAIDRDQLTLAYQPIVDLGANRITGFEALARWRHPERGLIDPAEFIPVAEEAGLIVPLGRWAVDSALATLADWDRAAGRALALSVSVNVSAIQLQRDDVAGMIANALAHHGIAGDRLTVELTESAIVQDPERATRALLALKAVGARIAMDDFGTGYSSLTYLRKLPIDILKIDRSFVSGMLADRDKVAIVRAVLSLADALGKRTTAEGVETIELAQTLTALGCSHGQGYYYAAPLAPAAALDYWLARNA